MQQTALNLTAIGVFTITMLSVLSPILQISPTIPAGITFSILTLATIDTLGWESRGITILLDWLSPQSHRERVLHHEAGHFLVAYLLSIPVNGYTLTAWEAWKQKQLGLGGVIFNTEKLDKMSYNKDSTNLLLERFCTVWMAGIAAEKLVYGNAEGGKEDKQKIQQMLMSAGFSAVMCRQKQRFAFQQATELLTKNQDCYQALVQAMEKRASVLECYQVIKESFSIAS